MRIVVLSDTHMPKKAKKLPHILMEELKKCDLIIHAGDWQTLEVFEELSSFGPIEGVHGNVDEQEMMERFAEKKILTINQFHIGIVHGHGKGSQTEKRTLKAFKNEKVHCIVFGHSHIPLKKVEGDILLFNPGSPTDKRRQSHYSFGIMEISDQLHVEHIFFERKD